MLFRITDISEFAFIIFLKLLLWQFFRFLGSYFALEGSHFKPRMNVRTSTFQIKTIIPSWVYLSKRTCSQSPEGIKYYGFTYFPRNEKFKDPPYEPSKLFLIRRIKSMSGRNPRERQCLALLNIDGERKWNGHINIVKNIPTTNSLLWKIKHLVEIKPIVWEGELPKDFLGTYLRSTGELVISPKLKVTNDQLEATEKIFKSNRKPSRTYLMEYLKNQWWHGFTGTS